MIEIRSLRTRIAIMTVVALSTVAALSTPSHADSVTDGQRTLTVSATSLDPSGQTVRVTGSGYDTFKGIYVTFCVVPRAGQTPSPCGGGADTSGASGASHWISSNPPPYGVGLAIPYGPGGSFDVTLTVSAALNASIDCRFVQCAVVTRNDHTRSSDRSQDVLVPVSFATPTAPTPPKAGGNNGNSNAPIQPGATPPSSSSAPTDTVPPVGDIAPAPTDPAIETTSTTESSTVANDEQPVDDEELASASTETTDSGSGGAIPIVLVVALVAAIGVGVGVAVRRRRTL